MGTETNDKLITGMEALRKLSIDGVAKVMRNTEGHDRYMWL